MRKLFFSLLASACMVFAAHAEPPQMQTPSPVIYLADNLDEKDQLGWCIDTLGRGFAERLQAHSCKPRGGDVQFSYEAETGLIRSVAFADYCMAHEPNSESVFALTNCDAASGTQQFAINAETGAITPKADSLLCVSVGESSRSAGPFMSRTLLLTACDETDALFRKWVVRQ